MANANPRGVLLTLLIIFLIFSPDSQQPTVGQQFRIDQAIAGEWASLDVLNTSRVGDLDALQDRWLNLTGLRHDDGLAWQLLEPVKDRARQQTAHVLGANDAAARLDGHGGDTLPLYRNVTGYVRGRWARSGAVEGVQNPRVNLSAVAPGAYTSDDFTRNITGRTGNIRIRLNQKDTGGAAGNESIAGISAQVSIKDETSSGDGWEISMYGVHFLEFGGILLTTTSEK